MPKESEQLEFGVVAKRDSWVEKLEMEFSLKLMPILDKSYPTSKCREVGMALAELAARRARDAKVLPETTSRAMCAGCDAEVEVAKAVCLCKRCSKGVRSAGSDG